MNILIYTGSPLSMLCLVLVYQLQRVSLIKYDYKYYPLSFFTYKQLYKYTPDYPCILS